jgi:hypothetical protein
VDISREALVPSQNLHNPKNPTVTGPCDLT